MQNTIHGLIKKRGEAAGQHKVATQNEWETKAASLLKAELKRAGVTYVQLAEMIGDREVNIRNKLSRGKFSAAFFSILWMR